MAQHTDVLLTEANYTRTDYTALRAYCLKIPLGRIADLYYCEDSPQVTGGLERFLIEMRRDLVERAVEHNPHFAEILAGARQGGAITTKALEILIKAADMPRPRPAPIQSVAQWFRPKTARALRLEGVTTLGQLVDLINRRGTGWWRSIPRIGDGRARRIMAWLGQHENALGPIAKDKAEHTLPDVQQLLDPAYTHTPMPLGSFYLPSELDGSRGLNRSPLFPFIAAKTDLAALECFLTRYVDRPETFRAYRKELERFALWAAMVARKPISSLLVDDCSAYQSFLRDPLPSFRGPRAPRDTRQWRPFADREMSVKSQKYAVMVIRAAFQYLVAVRYLAGNPWLAVNEPASDIEMHGLKIERALSENTWRELIGVLHERGKLPENKQDRVALAALLLMGDSGLRRAEAVRATRDKLRPGSFAKEIGMLRVSGKGRRIRDVPVSPRTLNALRAHWADRGMDFENVGSDLPLLAPVIIPKTPQAMAKHQIVGTRGYTPNAIFDLVKSALVRVSAQLRSRDSNSTELSALTCEELDHMLASSPHAFRHTCGTTAADKDVPVTVIQEILGHQDSATTAIYVRAREKRIEREASKLYFNEE